MLFCIPRNSRSNPAPASAESQHIVQPKNTYKLFKISLSSLFRRSRHDDTTSQSQMPTVKMTALGIRQVVPVEHEQHVSVDNANNANDIPQTPGTPYHGSLNPATMQAECRKPLPDIAEPATFSVATQFQGAQGFNISGQTQFTNIGGNVTTVNNYGGTYGLENLKEFVSFTALYDSAEQDPTRRCHPGTRKNVLSRLRGWIDEPNATDRIAWLHGPAGAGKSAIAQTIAHAYEDGEVAATFFFYRSDPSRNNGNRLFPTIAWQLAFSNPAIKSFVVHVLDKTPHLPMKDVETQFKQLVAHPFHPTNNISFQMPQPAPVVIIDGLDECSNEELQRRILAVIGNAVKDCLVPLRFLICSRPEALIEEVLDQFKDFTLRIDLAALDDSNRDIEKYLVDQFSDIKSKRGLKPTWPGPEIIEEFVFKSSGNFIFAATVMRHISDEDYSPESQLDIVRNLKPHGKLSPFGLLDELYTEILRQQRDQDFLKAFLALLVGRSSVNWGQSIHYILLFSHAVGKDDATLMNVSEQELHIKLRRMRSLFRFEPSIDVHHKSFLDFLQDSSRSGEYHVRKQDGLKRYVELIVDCVVRHIEQPNGHEIDRCSSPSFKPITGAYPPMIKLHVEDWQDALRPLLDLQNRLLNTLKPQPCHVSQVMRDLLLHLVILQGNPYHIVVAQVPDSNMNVPVTEQNPTLATEAGENTAENDLNRCLSVLLSCPQKPNSTLAVDTIIIERMASLLAFDCAETAARVRSVTDAQILIDLIDLVINNQSLLSQCGRDAARKATLLASEIYARVPLLPRSVFVNEPRQQSNWFWESNITENVEVMCQSAFISRILDHNYILPIVLIQGKRKFVDGEDEQNESLDKWLKGSSPNFFARIQVMVQVARIIRYIHSMNIIVALDSSSIKSGDFVLDSDLRTKIVFHGYFAWVVKGREESGYWTESTSESNISAFAELFQKVCFDGSNEDLPNDLVEDAKQLIERCRAEEPKSRPTMENVVKEMEAWNFA